MDYPKVSIRIPAYNHEKYIGQCLNSVLTDPYPNKELLIIDDGSIDRTPQIIHDWIKCKSPDFPVIFQQRENRGLTKTLNELIGMCSGEYLVSLASDDYLLSGGIQSRVEYLIDNPDKDAVFSDCIVVDDKGDVLHNSGLTDLYSANISKLISDKGILEEIISNWSVPGPVLMVRYRIYDKVGLYNENLRFEDWDFYLRMASANIVGFLDIKVSAYRLHGKNACMNQYGDHASHIQRLKTAISNFSKVPYGSKWIISKQILFYMYLYIVTR